MSSLPVKKGDAIPKRNAVSASSQKITGLFTDLNSKLISQYSAKSKEISDKTKKRASLNNRAAELTLIVSVSKG